jgi:uncharacterized protein YutE (UPF0331/DUF86 family)
MKLELIEKYLDRIHFGSVWERKKEYDGYRELIHTTRNMILDYLEMWSYRGP